MRHANLEANADKVIYMGEKCNKGIYYGRNIIMVDNSNRLICYWDGERGGNRGYNRICPSQKNGYYKYI